MVSFLGVRMRAHVRACAWRASASVLRWTLFFHLSVLCSKEAAGWALDSFYSVSIQFLFSFYSSFYSVFHSFYLIVYYKRISIDFFEIHRNGIETEKNRIETGIETG